MKGNIKLEDLLYFMDGEKILKDFVPDIYRKVLENNFEVFTQPFMTAVNGDILGVSVEISIPSDGCFDETSDEFGTYDTRRVIVKEHISKLIPYVNWDRVR